MKKYDQFIRFSRKITKLYIDFNFSSTVKKEEEEKSDVCYEAITIGAPS